MTRQTNQPGVSDPKSSPTSDGTDAQRQTGSSTTNEISLNLQQITINEPQSHGLLTVDSCHPGGHQTRSDSISVRHPGVTKSQMREFREAFRLFDKDGDGSITKEELGRVMRSLGQFARTEELQQMLQEIDVDGDGNVSFEEFVDIVANMGTTEIGLSDAAQEEQELRDAFRVFDKHNRGYISASDLRAVLQCLGEDLSEEEIEDMIKEVDVDGDGRIDFYEFVHALGEPGNEDSCEIEDEDEENLIDKMDTNFYEENVKPLVRKFGNLNNDKNVQIERDISNKSEKLLNFEQIARDEPQYSGLITADINHRDEQQITTNEAQYSEVQTEDLSFLDGNKKQTDLTNTQVLGVTKKQMKEFQESFRLFDKDGNGRITKEELGSVMKGLRQFTRKDELQRIIQELDVDGDGCISIEEFVAMVGNVETTDKGSNVAAQELQDLQDAFRVFDKYDRGYISSSDLRVVLQCMGEDLTEQEIEDMIEEVDVDGDGRIDFNEFVTALGEPGNGNSDEDYE
ncbi:calcium-binding protein LPS1-alpha-like [Chrysoperla carnea]|uniref:calcium-binding protein LPS1-alpha-like n=1 Tax=Chrysoperla carnea TaxID=189513 RepID=UPI001D062CDF|nr:calcium-binding protein LPS1-alpha-like [Chrysoperla carnea]